MSVGSHVHGVTTYTAGADLHPRRLVKIKEGSVTLPSEVEYTTDHNIVGITVEAATTGNPVAIAPLNDDGTFEIEIEINTAINPGTYLYLGTDGRGTDDDSSGVYIGIAVEQATVSGTVIQFASIIGGITAPGEAVDVHIDDPGNYYESTNVESALQEIGSWYARYFEFNSGVQLNRVNTNWLPLNSTELGGLLTADSADLHLSRESEILAARTNIGAGNFVKYVCSYPFISGGSLDTSAPGSAGIYYSLDSILPATYSIVCYTKILLEDGTLWKQDGSFIPVPSADNITKLPLITLDFSTITSPPIMVYQYIQLNQNTGLANERLLLYSTYFNFKQEMSIL